MKNISLILLLSCSSLLFGESFEADINIHVKGLVCDFCARSVEKTFGKLDSVEAIKINLEAGVINLDLKENQELSDEKIKKLIKANGYSLEFIERNP